MLEELAIQFVSMSEDILGLIGYGLFVVGGSVAAIVMRSKIEIARAPYFAYSAMISLLMGISTAVFVILSNPAVTSGYLWVLVVFLIASLITGGCFYCRLAMARSRDAYGNARRTFMAFIPIINLWLLLTRSKDETSTNRIPTIPLVSGGLGVLTGFVLLAATVGVDVYIEEQGYTIEQQAQRKLSGDIKAVIEMSIRSNGLEETLRVMASNAKSRLPIKVDETTKMAWIVAVGKQLRRSYLVDMEGMEITEKFKARSRTSICESALQPILRAGGSILEVYVERSRRKERRVDTVLVTRHECEF